MKKIPLLMLILAASLVLLLTGCSGSDQETAETPATEAAAEVVATHDCDGACGMKAVPVEKMTEIEGKFYCAGCAAKAKSEAEGQDGHEGHNHG